MQAAEAEEKARAHAELIWEGIESTGMLTPQVAICLQEYLMEYLCGTQ